MLHSAQVYIELAASDRPRAERMRDDLLAYVGGESVYPNRLLRVTFGPTSGSSDDEENSVVPDAPHPGARHGELPPATRDRARLSRLRPLPPKFVATGRTAFTVPPVPSSRRASS